MLCKNKAETVILDLKICMLLTRCLKYKTIESERIKNIYYANTNQKNAGVGTKKGRLSIKNHY